MSEEIKVLKVRFNKISLVEASDLAINWAKGEEQKQIVTPNPEILLKAQENPKFLRTLNNADLSIADGTGILWAAKYLKLIESTESLWTKRIIWLYSLIRSIQPSYLKSEIHCRVTGVDLMKDICKKAANNNLKIFLLGGEKGVAERAKHKLEKKFPGLEIIDTDSANPDQEQDVIKKVRSSEAEILFVAYGAPKQEFWIQKNLHKMPEVKVAIGVGGSFDFIAGTKARAPQWMQKTGLEWLYRLMQEPRRLKRIINAVIKFPLAILRKSTNQKPLKKRIQTWLAEN